MLTRLHLFQKFRYGRQRRGEMAVIPAYGKNSKKSQYAPKMSFSGKVQYYTRQDMYCGSVVRAVRREQHLMIMPEY